jgi:Zn-finger nucleic acid-binding protein
MAHTDIEIMENKLSDFQRISPVVSGELENNETDKRWMVFVDTSWLGPFSLDDLKGLDNFNPNQWIRQEGSEKVQLVSDYPELLKIFSDKKGGNVKDCCPYCKTGLREVIYEGTSILKCRQCEGIFVEQNKINRILVRTDKKFSEETIRMAKAILNDNSHSLLTPRDSRSVWKIKCPKCDLAMGRQFFQYSYPIEVDRCVRCYGIWFDKNELELLQYFYENNILGST